MSDEKQIQEQRVSMVQKLYSLIEAVEAKKIDGLFIMEMAGTGHTSYLSFVGDYSDLAMLNINTSRALLTGLDEFDKRAKKGMH